MSGTDEITMLRAAARGSIAAPFARVFEPPHAVPHRQRRRCAGDHAPGPGGLLLEPEAQP